MTAVGSISARRTILLVLALLLAVSASLVGRATVDAVKPSTAPKIDFELTILHNNDGESRLREAFVPLPPIPPATLSPGPDLTKPYAGVARFKALVDILKSEATSGEAGFAGRQARCRHALVW